MWPFGIVSREKIIKDKQETRKRRIEAASQELLAIHTPYLTASATEIVQKIASGEWTASEVVDAYVIQAAKAHVATNCLTEVLFDEAREEARRLDLQFRATGQLRGPLHGVPISFKDLFDIAGYDTTAGHSIFANKPVASDAELVRLIREAGGIPLAKTNVPQTLMFFECVNPMWGRTTNPYSAAHTSGGSSGGEGALLAMDGSAIGWGNDIGGSLRIPAGYCGIYSLMPSYGRVSIVGANDNLPGFEAVATVVGPLARSVEDLELALRVVVGKAEDDPRVAPVSFRDVVLPEKLRIGYYTSDNFVRSSPACQRGVTDTVAALRRAGHECVEMPLLAETDIAMLQFFGLTSADGNQTLLRPVGKDSLVTELAMAPKLPKIWGWVRTIICWTLEHVIGDSFAADVIRMCAPRSVYEYWKLTVEMREFEKRMNRKFWGQGHLDAVLAPVQAVPALPHGAVANISSICGSTILFNLMGCPVGVVPVTRVDPEVDSVTPAWYAEKQRGVNSSPLLHMALYKGANSVYNAKKMIGLPVGIQVIGKRWEDEKLLATMKVIDSALGQRSFGPGTWQTYRGKQ